MTHALRVIRPAMLAAATLLASAGARAAGPVQVAPLSAGSVFSVLFGLAIVVGLLLGTAWLLRRFQNVQQAAPGVIRPMAQLQLGLKEHVVLIRVGDENILLGCTPQGIRPLHSWQGPAPQGGEGAPLATPGAPFADLIKRLLAERKS